MQEAIITVSLGKAAFAEKNYSSSLGQMRGGPALLHGRGQADTMSWGGPGPSTSPPACVLRTEL